MNEREEKMIEEIQKYALSQKFLDEMKEIRRHLHKNPELSGKEYKTTEFIKEFLKKNDIEILPLDLKTGVVAEIGKGEGKIIALRADIDALPILEETDLPYKSQNEGVMHACGHDFHTTSLLGAALILKEREVELKGKVRLIFQPSEEVNSGAQEVIDAGGIEGVSAIVGFHNKPDLSVGTIGIKAGPLMAAVDKFEVVIKGTGSHAAAPHNGQDPIVTAAQIVNGVQSIVNRYVSPLDSAVISITRIEGGNTWNVIPEKVELEGTMRTYHKEVQNRIKTLFSQIVENYTIAFNQKSKLIWSDSHPSVNNDRDMAEAIKEKVSEFSEVIIPEVTLGGEDFSLYMEKIPGFFAFVGTDSPYEWHNPRFLIRDEALYYSINYYLASVTALLREKD